VSVFSLAYNNINRVICTTNKIKKDTDIDITYNKSKKHENKQH